MKNQMLMAATALLVASGTAQAQDLNNTNRGSYDQAGVFTTGGAGTAGGNYLTGDFFGDTNYSFFVFDLAGIAGGTIGGATLIFDYPGGTNDGVNPLTFNLYDYTGSIAALIANTAGVAGYNDLGSGVLYGSTVVNLDSTGFSVTLNDAAIAALNSSAGSQFAIGGSVVAPLAVDEFLFGFTLDSPPVILRLTSAIPEPGTWAMMLLGFGLSGLALRNRTRRPRMLPQTT